MMRRIVRTQTRHARIFLISGFALVVLLVVLAGWFGVLQRASTERALASAAGQRLLNDVFFSVQQAESNQRGYLLTGDPAYLTPYLRAMRALPERLANLQGAMRAAGEQADFAALNAMVSSKMAEIARTISLAQGGDHAAALALVRTNTGLNDMDNIRVLVNRIETRDAQSLDKLESANRVNVQLFQLAALFSVAGTLLLAWYAIGDNRKQTRELAALGDELNRIFMLSTDIIKVSDADGRILSLNPAWTQITGFQLEDSIGRTFRDFVHPDDLAFTEAMLAKAPNSPEMLRFENRFRRTDGSYRTIAWRIVPLPEERRAYAIGRDMTDEKIREEQLRQSQKMEVVGQLTGGIAHDFNNLLTVIMGSLELLDRSLANADYRISRRITAAMDSARRAAALTHRMLAFARRQPLDPQAVDPNKMVASMSEILHRVLGEHIALELVCAAGLWRVMADGHQLENAILNLAVNARDAMQGGGHLTIETQNMYLDDAYAAAEADVAPGQYVLIAVTDTGIGMTQETIARAFEPFFTTKPVGQGTGLGLPQVYGFIKQSNGHIKIYSEPGQGTTVKLYLPRLRGAEGAPAQQNTEEGIALAGNGETILVVEDEESVRKFSAEVLREFGYHVIDVENAAGALPVISSKQPIDLMFTDVVLTGDMNGRQLADLLTARRPGTPVLFTTGYTRNAIIHNGRLDEGTEFLGKPFSATALGHKVRKILGAVEVK